MIVVIEPAQKLKSAQNPIIHSIKIQHAITRKLVEMFKKTGFKLLNFFSTVQN